MINKFQRIIPLKRLFLLLCIILVTSFFISSCKIYQPTFYFKDITRDTVINGFVTSDMDLKIQQNDLLAIFISSLSVQEDVLFNKAVTGKENQTGFQVSKEGDIYMHKLGKIAVAGLTRKELKSKLETDLLPYLKDPIVTISFVNHRVTVLGENSSMVVEMPEEKISLMEVMAISKGVTINSQLSKIMVIRETKNTKEIKQLNLEDPSIFTSPWYYLQPNDIVVVKPNEEKINSEAKRTRNQLLYTTILTGVTFIFLIIDRLLR